MRTMTWLVLAGAVVLSGGRLGLAATYYVDFDAGKDTNDGTGMASAWQHAPGDPAAKDAAGKTELVAGDTVKFKGGVDYRGNLICKWSGEKGKPIVYDGNVDGKWGDGKAIVDGSEKLGGWAKCALAEECGGNENWKNIWWTYAPAAVVAVDANLCEGQQLLYLSEEPKQPDPFFMERTENFFTIPNKDMTKTSMVDPKVFNQKDEHYWDGVGIVLWTTPNAAIVRKITGYVPAENKVTFEDIGGEPYRDRDERYCVYNSIHLISKAGEYFFDDKAEKDGRHKVFLWPRDGGDLNQQETTVSVRANGFDVKDGISYLTVQGFRIELFSGAERNNGVGVRAVGDKTPSTGLLVKDNVISHLAHPMRGYGGIFINQGKDCLVEGNQVLDNPGSMGILITNGDHFMVKDNIVRNPGSQGIWFMGCKNSQIVGNTVEGAKGTHANGISVYLGSENILISGNYVVDSNIDFTMQASKHLLITNNVFDGSGKATVASSWGTVEDVKVFNNVFINARANTGLNFQKGGKDKDIVVKNNIIDGFPDSADWDVSNNVYLSLGGKQKLQAGEILEPEMAKLFVAPEKGDFHLKAGSPAIGAGTEVGVKEDKDGAARGTKIDAGAYLYKDAK